MILREDGEIASDGSQETFTSSESEECSDDSYYDGDMLMLKRLMGSQMCLVLGNMCSMIIDGSSCVNVASERLVSKLALPTIVHPRLYKLQLMSEHGELIVNYQVEISFTLGKYKDKVLCDVVPMEATHLLLGRPWQYERKVVLKSLSPRDVQEDQNKMREKRKEKKKRRTRTIVSNRDFKFFGHSWRSLWSRLRTKLLYSISYHPQPNRQTKIVNRTLGQLLRYFIGKNEYLMWNFLIIRYSILPLLIRLSSWLMVLTPSPYLICFLYLFCLTVLMMKACLEPNLFKCYMIRSSCKWKGKDNNMLKEPTRGGRKFSPRKEILKEQFPHLRRSKLLSRGDDPFKILKNVNDNSYQVDIPEEFGGSNAFNVIDQTLCDATEFEGKFSLRRGDDAYMKRENPTLQGKDEEDPIESSTLVDHPKGPKRRPRRVKASFPYWTLCVLNLVMGLRHD
ncbi:hypothetical protein CR513_51961, partial [Mucuna pruriens]